MKVKNALNNLFKGNSPWWNRIFLPTIFKKSENRAPKSTPKEWTIIEYKAYERFPLITLPKPAPLRGALEDSLLKRKSSRKFLSEPCSIGSLSTILYYAFGVIPSTTDQKLKRRFFPSAGARFPLEAYILVNNVSGLKKGLYHYYVRNHSLEYMWKVPKKELYNAFLYKWPVDGAFLIVISCLFDRTVRKYSLRGLRYAAIEAGHIGQNLYLVSAHEDIGCCAIGGFYDLQLNQILQIESTVESTLYVCSFGKSSNFQVQ